MIKALLIVITSLVIISNVHSEMFPKTPSQGCVNFALKLIKEDLSAIQIKRLANICKFNNDGLCLYEFTKDISHSQYDELHEVINLARNCQFVRPRCVGVVKKYLKREEYQSNKSIVEIGEICTNTSYKCLDYECSITKNSCDELTKIKSLMYQCLR